MCPDLPIKKKESPQQTIAEIPTSLVNLNFANEVLLQKVMVTVINQHKGESLDLRALLGPGSQRSYISKRVAQELSLKPVEEIEIRHSLFGCSSEVKKHGKYDVEFSYYFKYVAPLPYLWNHF